MSIKIFTSGIELQAETINIARSIFDFFPMVGYNVEMPIEQGEDYISFLATNTLIKNVKEVYDSLKSQLCTINKKAKIQLSESFHDEFIMLLFYIEAVIKHVPHHHEQENRLYKSLIPLLKTKQFLLEHPDQELIVKIYHSNQKFTLPESKNYHISFDKDLELLLNNFKDINLEIQFEKPIEQLALTDVKKLIAAIKPSDKDFTSTIQKRGGVMLCDYLNSYASRYYSNRKFEKIVTRYHVRFLLPLFDIMKWDFISEFDDSAISRVINKWSGFAKQYNALKSSEF